MKKIRKAIQAYISENRIDMNALTIDYGWDITKLKNVIEGSNKLNAADYGIICEALGVDYDHFPFMLRGISN